MQAVREQQLPFRVTKNVTNAVTEEDAYDLKCYEKAMASYKADPVTYTLDEVEAELGLV